MHWTSFSVVIKLFISSPRFVQSYPIPLSNKLHSITLDIPLSCHCILHMLRCVVLPRSPATYYLVKEATFIIIVTPSRIAQYLYDRSRMLAETPFGWLALAATIGVLFSLNPIHRNWVQWCTSDHLIPSFRRPYNSSHFMRLCIWNEGLLYRCFRVTNRCCARICGPPFSLQSPPSQVVLAEW